MALKEQLWAGVGAGPRTRCALLVMVLVAFAATSGASGSTATVSASVPSAAWIDGSGCASETASVTSFGAVLPDVGTVTTLDCIVRFGASNDTARLRTYQSDGTGTAMWAPTRGEPASAWGIAGTVAIDVSAGTDLAKDILIFPDGGVLAVGTANDFATMVRLDASGNLDPTFDGDPSLPGYPGNGIVMMDVLAWNDTIRTVEPWGSKFVVTGDSGGSSFVMRLDADGSFDATFDGDGLRPIPAGPSSANLLHIGADGTIVVGGTVGVRRLLPSGADDPMFDGDPSWTGYPGNGFVTNPECGAEGGLEVFPDGRILVASKYPHWDLCRLTVTGAYDTTFDGDGRVHTVVSPVNDSYVSDLLVRDDGSIVVFGTASDADWNMEALIGRYTASGAVDPTFGTGGRTYLDIPATVTEWGSTIGELPDRRLLGFGSYGNNDGFVARFHEDGALDTTLGSGGWQALAAGQLERARPGSDGTWFVAAADGYPSPRFLISKYDADRVGDHVDGTNDWTSSSTSMFAACLRDALDGAASGTGTWIEAPSNACMPTDGTHWNAIPAAAPGATIATSATPDAAGGASDPTARLRFGFRAAAVQQPGAYAAAITFEVVSPDL